MLARGVCADLAQHGGVDPEFRRCAGEIIRLMQSAGIAVRSEIG